MSFSRLLQNAPFYSPARASPSRKREAGPSSALERVKRARGARPLVDPYAALPAPEFDTFVDDVSSRIVNALTYEPNKDRRIRRGYADDEEYWMEMGGKPGEFVGNLTQEVEHGDAVEAVPEELEAEEVDAEDVEDAMSEDVVDDIEAGESLPVDEDIQEEQAAMTEQEVDSILESIADHQAPAPSIPASTDPAYTSQVAASNHPIAFNGIYPDLAPLDEDGSLQSAAAANEQDVQIQPGNLYPSLDQLQVETAPPITVNEDYQFDLLRQFTHEGFSGYADSTPEFLTTQSHGIEDLLEMAERDAEEANEAIQHLQEEDEREQELDDELLEEIQRTARQDSMRVDSSEEDIVVPLDEDENQEEADVEEAEASSSPENLELPPSKQKSASREASDVISIGSTSDEDEEEDQEDEEEDQEDEEEEIDGGNVAIDLEEEEEEEEESEVEDDSLEVTPPPVQPVHPPHRPGPSRQLFGQLDAPVPSQARLMSQKLRRRMDEDDLRTSGFDEEDAPIASGSSDASDEHAREWQQFRRKAGKGQRAQDEQDAADRYFDDEEEGDEHEQHSDRDDEEEEESDEGGSEEDYTARSYRKMAKRAAAGEFEDELDDDAVADEERQASRLEADLHERVPIPAFMKRDEETGEYDLRIGSSSEADEEDSEEEQATEDEIDQQVHEDSQEELKIEVLQEQEVEIQVDEDLEVLQTENTAEPEDVGLTSTEEVAGMADNGAVIDMAENAEAEADEIIDLAHSDNGIADAAAQANETSTRIDVNAILETSIAADRPAPALLDFAGLPPLPQSLMDVADNLVDEALETVQDAFNGVDEVVQNAEEDMINAVLEVEQAVSTDSVNLLPVMQEDTQPLEPEEGLKHRRKSREPSLPAITRTPRKSVEPKLVASIGVSPEQFSLSPKPSRSGKARDEPLTAESQAPAEIGPSEVKLTAKGDEAATPSLLAELPSSFSNPSQSKTNAASNDDISSSVGAVEDAISHNTGATAQSGPTQSLNFTEDHHHEPPPPELMQEAHSSGSHATRTLEEPVEGIDLTTDEMENHSADGGEAEERPETTYFTEDHHHEPPPPELTQEEHFPADHAAGVDVEPMEGIDLTTDEMENHSANEEEAAEQPKEAHFTEDHHFEPPPPELQEDSEPKIGEEILLDVKPLNGVDMTTDEMEQHSADEEERGPVHEIGYVEQHLFEPPALPSQTEATGLTVGEETMAPSSSIRAPEAQPNNEVASASSASLHEQPIQVAEDPAIIKDAPDSQPIAAASSEPSRVPEADTPSASTSTKETGTPSRTFNVIKPGLWDPSTPIRFGGRSLEAAVREAYYDPDRSENLKKSLEADESTSIQAPREGTSSLSDDAIKAEADFVPLPTENDTMEDEEEETDEDIQAALISSPGIRQPDGSLTEAVKEGDYIGDTVTDALIEDSELPPLEPEVLQTLEDSEAGCLEASSSTSRAGSTASLDLQPEESPDVSKAQSPISLPVVHVESSSEDSDDDHHVATSLLRTRTQTTTRRSKTPVETRRGRSGTRSVGAASRKGKERAIPEVDEEEGQAEPTDDDETAMEEEGTEQANERATTPEKDSHGRNVITTVIVPGSPIAATTPMEELEVSAMLAPRPSQPRFHRHGTSGSIHVLSPPSRRRKLSFSSRSSTSRTSAEPVSGSSAAPVHPDAEHPSQTTSGSPIQTRSQCTYRKLMIPNPYLGSINTPGRRISTRLARAAGEAANEASQEYPSSFVFLVPGCVTADRKEQMQEGGIVDLGVASVEEEGSAMALQSNEENESGLHVEGLPDSVVQSLVRVVGLEMFREGDCEILAPLLPQGSLSPARNGNGTERKRRRESDMMSPPGTNKRLR